MKLGRQCLKTALICAAAFFAVDLSLSERAFANGTKFVLLGGLNLSSPRTASNISFASFTGVTGGFGFDVSVKENLFVEADFLFVNRRYSAGYSLPTFMFPLLIKFENRFLSLGIGPYAGFLLGVSSDSGTAATSDLLAMSTTDFGGIATAGIKVPLTQKLTGFADVRVSRALTSSYGGDSPFYWGQVQGYAGVQIAIGKKN